MSDPGSTPDDGLMAVEAYVAGTLPEGERPAVERLLASDERLRSYAADLQLVTERLPRAAYAAASDTAIRNMSVHVVTALGRRRQRRRWMVAVPATATAALALMVVVLGLPNDVHRPPVSNVGIVATDVPPTPTVATPAPSPAVPVPAPTTPAVVRQDVPVRHAPAGRQTTPRPANVERQLAYAVADVVAEDAIDDLVMDDVDDDMPSYSALTDRDIDILLNDWNDDAGS